MSYSFSVGEICERALRKIGALAVRSSGARKAEMDEARYWLDMVVGHEASRARTWWLVEASATFQLQAGVSSYDLNAVLGTAQAPNGLQFIVQAILYDATIGEDLCQLSLVRRQEWETRQLNSLGAPQDDYSPVSITDPYFGDLTDRPLVSSAPGQPEVCYVNRDQRPIMQIAPAPDANRTYGVRIIFQGFPSNFVGRADNDRTFKMRSAWNLWLITALAAQIGNGPVRKLPADEVRDMKQETQQLRNELEAYENDEHAGEPRRVEFHNL